MIKMAVSTIKLDFGKEIGQQKDTIHYHNDGGKQDAIISVRLR